MYALSLIPGIIVLHALICAQSSENRPERGLQAKSGKYGILSDPRVSWKQLAGHGDTTRE